MPPQSFDYEVKKKDRFVEALTELIKNSPGLMHLDISEMYLGTASIAMIMIEGVAESRTMAGVHFQDNKVDHWDRIRIFHCLTKRPQSRQEPVEVDP